MSIFGFRSSVACAPKLHEVLAMRLFLLHLYKIYLPMLALHAGIRRRCRSFAFIYDVSRIHVVIIVVRHDQR